MKHHPRISRVSKIKKIRRKHRCSKTHEEAKVFHAAPRQTRIPKSLNVVPVVENIESIPSTHYLPDGTIKRRSTNIRVVRVSRSEPQLTTDNKHHSNSQYNSSSQLITKSEYHDVQKPVIPLNIYNDTIISSNSFVFIDSKRHSTSRTDTTLGFHSRINTGCRTSKESLIDHNRQKLYHVDPDKEKNKEKQRRRRRRGGFWAFCCPCCSPCCCLLTGILLALLLGILAVLIGVLITMKTKSTTSTTTTTTSSSTSSTTTSVTTTTSTSSTSSTTSSTSTSSSTSSTTSSTSTSSSSSSSTSSTSTSSTSTSSTSATSTSSSSSTATSSTTTTVTTATTTTTAATVTITSNTCTSGWKGVTILYHCDNCPDISPYTKYTYTYTAISNRTRIAFSFREDSGCFALDLVSVRSITAPGVELILNNDFETGTLSSWTYCNPQSASNAGEVIKNSDNFQCMSYTFQSKSGTHFYYDGAVGNCDYLIQSFATNIGTTYTISYWLYNQGSGSSSSADVIISI